MAFPELEVSVALATRPTETPTWIDITNKVLSASARRGRDNEFGPMQMGTCEVVLDNTDRRFDPSYAGVLINYISNPSFETGLGWWYTAQGTVYDYGDTPVWVYTSGDWQELLTPAIACGGGETWTASFYAMLDETDVWMRYSHTVTTTVGATWIDVDIYTFIDGRLALRIRDSVAGVLYEDAVVMDVDAYVSIDCVQLEQGALSAYCDGAQDNCKWVGEAHNSNSIRGGPYYGNLLPMRRLRVRSPGEAAYYHIFAGYVDGWPQTWDDGVSPIITVRVCDGFKVLGLAELNETFTAELFGSRVNNVLDSVRWTVGGTWLLGSSVDSQLGTTTILGPTGGRAISLGDSTIMAQTLVNANALQYLNDVADSEYGLLYVDGSGSVVARNRHYMYGIVSLDVLGDAPDEGGYSDFALDYDDQHIFNDVRMCRIDGEPQAVSDTDSQLTYFKRTLQNDRLLLTTDAEVAARANYLMLRYKDPHWRSRGLTLGGSRSWSTMLILEIGDRITVTRRPQGGTAIVTQFRIEGIEHSIALQTPGQSWQTRFALSTADAISYWMITTGADEYASMGVLGTTTVIAY